MTTKYIYLYIYINRKNSKPNPMHTQKKNQVTGVISGDVTLKVKIKMSSLLA